MNTQRITTLIALSIFVLSIFSCSQNDEVSTSPGELQFTLNNKVDASNGRVASTPTSIVISLEDGNGNPVFTLEELPIVNFSGTYATSPVTLNAGDYQITEFLLLDESGETIYATPKAGSDKAYLVSYPLPLDISVSPDFVKTISPELISTLNVDPAAFGYASFGLTVVDTFEMLIAAMRFNIGTFQYELTDATVSVSGDGVALSSTNIAAETTQLTVRDGYDSYQVSVSKSGYTTETATYTLAEMKAFFDDPLTVELTQ